MNDGQTQSERIKVNEDKLLQAAVDYVAGLLCENGARVLNASPRGLRFETEVWPWIGSGPWTWWWEVQIEKDTKAQKVIPARNDAVVVATEQALRDAVKTGKVDTGPDISWETPLLGGLLFELTRDKENKRFILARVATIAGLDFRSERSKIYVSVSEKMHPTAWIQCEVAKELTDMLNAYLDGSVWKVELWGGPKGADESGLLGQHRALYGASRVLLAIIELLTSEDILPAGHGSCAATLVGGNDKGERQ